MQGALTISIHAAREGGDCNWRLAIRRAAISIHAAREGGDASAPRVSTDSTLFQSTPPVKAATDEAHHASANTYISIHAAREGGDENDCFAQSRGELFQSTPPVKAATVTLADYKSALRISIHAAREGGDAAVYGLNWRTADFNPRRP